MKKLNILIILMLLISTTASICPKKGKIICQKQQSPQKKNDLALPH